MHNCREDALIAAGFTDIFLPIKAAENASALALLPDICRELDEHEEQVGGAGGAGGAPGKRRVVAVLPGRSHCNHGSGIHLRSISCSTRQSGTCV